MKTTTILATALTLLAAPALAQGPTATPAPFKIVSGEERVTADPSLAVPSTSA